MQSKPRAQPLLRNDSLLTIHKQKSERSTLFESINSLINPSPYYTVNWLPQMTDVNYMDLNASHSKETNRKEKTFPSPLADVRLVCVCASIRKEMLLSSVYWGFAKPLTRQGRVGGKEGVGHQSSWIPGPITSLLM